MLVPCGERRERPVRRGAEPCPMSIEHFASRSSSLEEHLALVCAHHLPRNIETLDEHAGRALAHFSPDTGFYLDFLTKEGTRGSITGMVADDTIIPHCLKRDIPVLDTRPMTDDDRITLVFRGPMLGVGQLDFERPAFVSGPLSYLGTADYCALWVAKGAILHGEPYDLIDPTRPPFDGRVLSATRTAR